MKPVVAPPLEPRTAADFARELEARLASGLPGWSDAGGGHGAAEALVRAATRFAEIVAERVNRAPDRNRLAFLATAGASPRPPQAATVPLTFALAPGTTTDVIVPAGTRVASADEPGRPAQTFETTHTLVVAATRLDRLYVREPLEDRFADRRGLLATAVDPPIEPFRGDQPIEHSLSIGHRSLFGLRPVQALSLTIAVAPGTGDPAQRVAWELADGAGWTPLTPVSDSTDGLSRRGVVVFSDLGLASPATVDGRTMRWLRARALTPVTRPTLLSALTLQRELAGGPLPLDAGLFNGAPLDLTKDFRPFGPQPQFGDICYVTSAAAFSLANATVTLTVTLTQDTPDGAGTVPPVNADGRAQVSWEYWNGTAWSVLGRGRAGEDVRDDTPTAFVDTTRALTHSGEIAFRFAEAPQPTTIAGIEGCWLRARLAAGHYGLPPGAAGAAAAVGDPAAPPSPPSAPMVSTIRVGYRVTDTACVPDAVLAINDFAVEEIGPRLAAATGSVAVFRPTPDRRPSLYFGFDPPAGRSLAGHPLSVYLGFGGATRAVSGRPQATASPTVVCEYWSGTQGWTRLSPQDGTMAMTRSGTIVALPPGDCAPSREFGEQRYWLRALWRGSSADHVSSLRRVLLNTTEAVQGVTIRHEILGSSRGTADQVLRLSRVPVLDGVQIEVREDDGGGAGSGGGWVGWQVVPDLLDSGPADRHVVVDSAAGLVTFGDGRRGRIPPGGAHNVRALAYRAGGGAAGNVPARRIVQLAAAMPSIAGVTNEEPAAGGADAETLEAMVARAPRLFRHQQRAVTSDDYEDLAVLASTEVARARCVPLYDLAGDPDARRPRPGAVSVIVLPRGQDDRPVPSLALLARVRRFLADRQNPLVDLTVLGPEYVVVDVEATVRLQSLEAVNAAEAAIRSALSRFLHPVSGGRGGDGWDFGREPHRSDVFAVIGRIPGVAFVEALRLVRRPEDAAAWSRPRFLVSAGTTTLFFYA